MQILLFAFLETWRIIRANLLTIRIEKNDL